VLALVCFLGHARGAEPLSPAELIAAQRPFSNPDNRARAVEALRVRAQELQSQARIRALQLGLPLKGKLPEGGVFELAEFDAGMPLYWRTCNANAAISIGANVLRSAPYVADGTGGTVGVWDASSALTSHQEFGGRVTTRDGSSATSDHSSHVVGTLCAVGVSALARGMATNTWVDSYDWNYDITEMTGRGASYAGEVGKLYLSSHSYGFNAGWAYTETPLYTWYGAGTTAAAYEDDFGKYNDKYARTIDSLCYSLPYYLVFWASGNDRGSYESPAAGQSVALSPGGTSVAYDPALHPPRDDIYQGGYDTISYCALAKNVVTVGSVNDALNGGIRYLPAATMSSFSSWGPTDDGRIKPDVVANGASLTSSFASSATAYGVMSGTSMATPSAAGLAQQLVSYYKTRFPGQYMRASTLKGLLIHTADDLLPAGPDYKAGWGLLNGQAAADLIASAATNTLAPRLIEQQLTPAIPTRTHSFTWNGVSPIRVTLCWTDPAGAAQTEHNARTPNLVNNLNLRLVGPTVTQHFPYVMPFVGTWSLESMSAVATTGTNNTDNVEQVLVSAPPAAGTYQAVISYSGTLANSLQAYSLLITGSAPSAPNPQSVTPSTAESGIIALTVTGESFASGATVTFFRSGTSDVPAAVSTVTPTSIACSVDVTGMASGLWDVRVTNPGGKTGTLASAFMVVKTLFSQNFDPDAPGWTTSVTLGDPPSGWALSTLSVHTAPNAYRIVPPTAKKTDNLISEGFSIPSAAQSLRFHFWHRFTLESYDGGLLEISPNNGLTWYGIGSLGSGTAFVQGGYTTTIAGRGGNKSNRAEFVGLSAWNGSTSGTFSEVIVSLDSAIFAGKTLRARWRLSTDTVNDAGTWFWAVDAVRITGYLPPAKGTIILIYLQ